jgi:hypothetical protein
MRPALLLWWCFAGALAASAACRSAAGGAPSLAVARDRSVMDSTDLSAHRYPNVQEAIIALHPEWLTAPLAGRAVAPVPGRLPQAAAEIGIFVDDSKQAMRLDYLRTLQVEQVARIKHLSGSEAMATYGPQWISGAIVVTLRR